MNKPNEKEMSFNAQFKNHQGERANLIDISSKNTYVPYILDLTGKYSVEEIVILDKVENNIAYLRKVSNNAMLKISISKLQLVEEK